jgi:hypothetical protein
MRRHRRALKRRYGRALPLFLPAALAKLKAAGLYAPVVEWTREGWQYIRGRKRRKR